jgi:hypothetical protein
MQYGVFSRSLLWLWLVEWKLQKSESVRHAVSPSCLGARNTEEHLRVRAAPVDAWSNIHVPNYVCFNAKTNPAMERLFFGVLS